MYRRYIPFLLFILFLIPIVIATDCDTDQNIVITKEGTEYTATFNGNGEYMIPDLSLTFTLTDCIDTSELTACQTELGTCNSDLSTKTTDLTNCNNDLTTKTNSLSTCTTNLTDCNTQNSEYNANYTIIAAQSTSYKTKLDATNTTLFSCDNANCRTAWLSRQDIINDLNSDINSLEDSRDNAIDNLSSCGSNGRKNCKDEWNKTLILYDNCTDDRDTANENLGDCRSQRSSYYSQLNSTKDGLSTCQAQTCNATYQCPICQTCPTCTTCEVCQTCPDPQQLALISSPNSTSTCDPIWNCKTAWIVVACLFIFVMIIIISNIRNLRKEKLRQTESPPQPEVTNNIDDFPGLGEDNWKLK
jgi:hypothetical protein